MIIEQRLNLERDGRRHEGTQARLAGRLKFACCPICGSADGMDAVHRDTMALLNTEHIRLLAPWYLGYSDSEHLFHACDRCNRRGAIPTGFVRIRVADVPAWIDDNPMQPDYAALAAEPEPVLASLRDRESAGLEG